MLACPINHPSLPGMFDPQIPNNPPLWAVFTGWNTGKALVDEIDQPSQCVVHTDAVLTFASKQVSHDFLFMAIEYFQQAAPIWLIRSIGDPPAPQAYSIHPRLEFFDLEACSPKLSEIRSSLSRGYELRRIDQALLERCLWRDDMAFYCGSIKNFLRHGFGLCLMHGEDIIVEAYASAFGVPYAEIGAITHEPYRGQGYATIAVAYLIEALEARGFRPYWSCDTDNPASARVARKLGFMVERSYEIWEYQQAN